MLKITYKNQLIAASLSDELNSSDSSALGALPEIAEKLNASVHASTASSMGARERKDRQNSRRFSFFSRCSSRSAITCAGSSSKAMTVLKAVAMTIGPALEQELDLPPEA